MTISYLKSVGAASSSDTGITALPITVPAAGVAAGNLLIARFAAWNYGGSGTAVVSDSRGNTWSRDFGRISTSDGMNVVYSTIVSTPLVQGDTITVTFPAGNNDYAFAADEFAGVHPTARLWQLDPNGVSGDATHPSFRITPNANPPRYTLHISPLFFTGLPTDGYTPDTDSTGGSQWTELTFAYSPADSHAQALRGAYKTPAVGQTGLTQTWSPVLGVSRQCLIMQLIYQGGVAVTPGGDVAGGVRAGSPVSSLAIDVVLTTDVPAGSYSAAPGQTVNADPPGPWTVTSDVAAGVRAGSPSDALAIDVPLTIDLAGTARSGAAVDGPLAIDVPLTTDTPSGTRVGASADGPLAIGVTLATDAPAGSRAGVELDVLAIGIVVASDSPAGTRSGAPDAAIGNTITSDVPAGTYSGVPSAVLAGAGALPKPPSTLNDLLPNPNRPIVLITADFTSGPPTVVGMGKLSLDSPRRRNAVRKISSSRGRQYELDQVQSGTLSLDITDPLEYLNVLNTASPFMTGGRAIKPYRSVQWAALYPTNGNLINRLGMARFQATNGAPVYSDPSFETSTGLWAAGPGTTMALSTAQAWIGAQSLQVTQTSARPGFGVSQRFDTSPSLALVFSCYVMPMAGTTVTVQVTDGAGQMWTSNAAATPGVWTRIFVSWRCVETLEKVEIVGAASSAPAFAVDATQLEFSLQPTDFTTAGPVARLLYSGYIERFPLQYDMNGTRGLRPLTAVDALAVLSRTQVTDSYTALINGDNPAVHIPFTDTAGPPRVLRAGGFSDLSGFTHVGNNNGAVSYGGDQLPDGTSVLVLSQQNDTNAPTKSDPNYITNIGTVGGAWSANTSSASVEVWYKFSAGTCYFGVAAIKPGENLNTSATGPAFQWGWYTGAGRLFLIISDPNGHSASFGLGNNANYIGYPDASWHHAVMIFNNGTFLHVLDGAAGGSPSLPAGFAAQIAMRTFYAQATTYFGDPLSSLSIAHMATYNYAMPVAEAIAHYQRGIGYTGEKSGARVARLLHQYWRGGSVVARGLLDMAPDFGYSSRMMLDVLQEIQESERGLVFADVAGNVVFEDRSSRYLNQAPLWTFGENAAAGEYPYEGFEGDYDPTYTFSQANLTRPGNNEFLPMVNTVTQQDYGQRILSQTMQAVTDFDLTEAGRFYLHRYGSPRVRIEKLTLNPAGNPALWPVVLSLEISQRVTVRRRAGGVISSGDYYVEQINHTLDADAGTWTVDLQLSPVFVPVAWVLGDATFGVLGKTSIPTY